MDLVNSVERLKLNVERRLPLHGRVVSVPGLHVAVGEQS